MEGTTSRNSKTPSETSARVSIASVGDNDDRRQSARQDPSSIEPTHRSHVQLETPKTTMSRRKSHDTGKPAATPRTERTKSSAAHSVSGVSTSEKDEEDPELEFDFVACGYSHTMLVTKNGGLLMACGNHRYGQLGIAEKNKEDDARNCQECTLLRAVKICNECEGPTGEKGKEFCIACWSTTHKRKANCEHRAIEIQEPPNLKFVANPKPVRRALPAKPVGEALETGQDAGEDDSDEEEGKHVSVGTLVSDRKLIDLTNVLRVACGDSHTLAIVQDHRFTLPRAESGGGGNEESLGVTLEEGEMGDVCGQVYVWGNGSSGRNGLVKPARGQGGVAEAGAEADEEGGEEEEEEERGREEVLWTDAEYEDQFYARPVAQFYGERMADSPRRRDGPGRGGGRGRGGDGSESESSSSTESSSDEEAWAQARMEHEEDPLRNAVEVACGGQHSLLLDRYGHVWSWGNNEYGQLGRQRAPPVVHGMKHCVHRRRVHFWHALSHSAVSVERIACGDRHCLAVGESGRLVFSWGCADNGRLGLYKTTGMVRKPTMIKFFEQLEVQDIACGFAHSAAVCRGTPPKLYTWGKNDAGQCGLIPEHHLKELNALANPKKEAKDSKDDKKEVKFPATPDISTPELVRIAIPPEYGTSPARPQPAANTSRMPLHASEAPTPARTPRAPKRGAVSPLAPLQRSALDSSRISLPFSALRSAGIRKSSDTTRFSRRSSDNPAHQHSLSQRRLSQRSKASQPHSDIDSRLDYTKSMLTGAAGEDDEGAGVVMVACGACHTLALLGCGWKQGKSKDELVEHPLLYLLGSGLDRRARIEDVRIKPLKNGKKQVLPGSSFEPRLIQYAFTDTAEISTHPPDEEDSQEQWDPVIYTFCRKEFSNPDDPEGPPIVNEHHCLTFTFAGDLDLGAGNTVAFTGPNAPPGLRLESPESGPWFEVLGEDDHENEQAEEEEAGGKKKGKTKQQDTTWDDKMGPGRKPFYLHKIPVEMLTPDKKFKRNHNPEKDDCEDIVVYDGDAARVKARLHKVEEKADGHPMDQSWPVTWLYVKTCTIENVYAHEQQRKFQTKDEIVGKHSGARAKAVGRLEEDTDTQSNHAFIWHKEPKRFTVEVKDTVLTTECDTYEKVAEWITQNVSTTDTENMLVCKRDDLPPLKQIASGAFHACALSKENAVLMWGMGALGRLGLGNQLEQLIPTALELNAVALDGIKLRELDSDDLPGVMVEEELEEGKWTLIDKQTVPMPVGRALRNRELLEVNMQRVDLHPTDPKLLQVTDAEAVGSGIDFAQKLLEGPEDSTVVLCMAKTLEDKNEGGQDGYEAHKVVIEMYKGKRDKAVQGADEDDD